jgi:hypothetical protein
MCSLTAHVTALPSYSLKLQPRACTSQHRMRRYDNSYVRFRVVQQAMNKPRVSSINATSKADRMRRVLPSLRPVTQHLLIALTALWFHRDSRLSRHTERRDRNSFHVATADRDTLLSRLREVLVCYSRGRSRFATLLPLNGSKCFVNRLAGRV